MGVIFRGEAVVLGCFLKGILFKIHWKTPAIQSSFSNVAGSKGII